MNAMFPSRYLGKSDVEHPITTRITRVVQEELKSDDGNELKVVLYFQGVEKAMICNKSNAFTLVDAYGDDSDQWQGKPIEIYVDHNIAYAGRRVGGLRLRIPVGEQSNGHIAAGNELWSIQQALERAAAVGITKDELRAAVSTPGKWNPGPDTPIVQRLIAVRQMAALQENFDAEPVEQGENEIPF